MTTDYKKPQCLNCPKDKTTSKCTGCLQDFCYNHLTYHRQELSRQLEHIELNRDVVNQKLHKQTNLVSNDKFLKQINQWEQDSIKIIQQTANECRQLLMDYRNQYYDKIEIHLKKFSEQIREIRQENNFDETDLNQFKEKFKQIQRQLQQPPNVSLKHDMTPLIYKISVVRSSGKIVSSKNINKNTKWKQNGLTVIGGNVGDKKLNQLYFPQGIYIDNDDLIYIADYENHRIVEWKSNMNISRTIAGGNGQGNRIDQINSPTDVIVDKSNDCLLICDAGNRRVVRWSRRINIHQETIINDIDCIGLTMDNKGDIYVSDCLKNEVRRWKQGDIDGTIVAGGNGKGDKLNQLSCPTYIFVDENYAVYVSDCNNNRVMKWIKDAKEGIIVAGGQGQGDSLTQLSLPQGVIVDHLGNVYVADSLNHRIMRWFKDSHEGSIVVGGNKEGEKANQFNCSVSLSLDRHGNLYVVDYNNHRVQKFDIDSS
ncbi:unnamed protein product [Adineta steineri]|uniref:Uncharacterized protein n=1 Tax=Adineta steineri TaxID=433720 RepID=A0A814UKI9_9BILA|nr:unnamed protein product [Adineta steineri]CAF1174730.1 unnamed protein product [Adineta steineri]